MSAFLRKLEVPHPPNEPRPTALLSHDVKPIEKDRRVWGKSIALTSRSSLTRRRMACFPGAVVHRGLQHVQLPIRTFFNVS